MCSECVMLTSLFQNHDRSLWLVYDLKHFSGGTGVVTPSKPPLPTKNFCLYPPPVSRCCPKNWYDIGPNLCKIRSKTDLYDNGTMSFTCEHSPNWQVCCSQIMAVVTLAFFPIV